MKQDTSEASATSVAKGDWREIKYVPYGVDEDVDRPIQYASPDGVEYDRFSTFAIKVVLLSDRSYVVPEMQNLRAIALD